MKQQPNETDGDFQTRQFKRKKIFTWSTVGTIAAIIVAVDVLLGWNTKISDALSTPEKFQKLSDIVWQDHQSIQRITDYLNIREDESPKMRDELSTLFTNQTTVAVAGTNGVDP
jgi:hypothetical protein